MIPGNSPETQPSGGGHEQSIKRQLWWLVNAPWAILLVVLAIVGGSYGWQAFYTYEVGSGVRQMSLPAVDALQSLQKERELSLEASSLPASNRSDLVAQRNQTDQALATMNKAAAGQIDSAPAEIKQGMQHLTGYFNRLPDIRRQVDSNTISSTDIGTFYNGLFDSAYMLFETQAAVVPQTDTLKGAEAAAGLFHVSDLMSRESALVTAALSTGELTPAEDQQFTSVVGAYHDELELYRGNFAPQVLNQYEQLESSASWQQLVADENQVALRGAFRRGEAPPLNPAQWNSITSDVNSRLQQMVRTQADLLSAKAVQDGTNDLSTVGLVAFCVVLAAGGFFAFSRWWSRRIVDEALVTRLRALRDESYQMAEQLPHLVDRLRSGGSVEVESVVAGPRVHGTDEVGQVAQASRQFLEQAIRATVGEARARQGARAVFVGMARRQQSLMKPLHKILTQGQQEESDPNQLKRWFEADHLATRARRNTDNLLVLAGQRPGRRWTDPVSLYEVIAGAVGEIERYLRVDITHVPENIALAGQSVRDTSHLLAELIDNATCFSNDNTRVRVWVEHAEHGALVEIEDAGLGMSRETRLWANETMMNPPEFDRLVRENDTVEQLGLFTAAHLARTHQIRVEFKLSTAGGTRASVLLPNTLLVRNGEHSLVPRAATIRGELPQTVNGAITGELPIADSALASADQKTAGAASYGNDQRDERTLGTANHGTPHNPAAVHNSGSNNRSARRKPSLGPKRVPGANLPDDLPPDTSTRNIVGDPTRIVGFHSAYNKDEPGATNDLRTSEE